MKDFYKTLGIGEEASQEEIKKSFRELAKKWHPDHNPKNKLEAEEKFKTISEAYETLGDEQKRSQYDQMRKGGMGGIPPFPGWGVSGFSDSFTDFFSQAPPFHKASQRGADTRVTMNISLEEVVTGCEKKASIKQKVRCDKCDGTGINSSAKYQACKICNGAGSKTTKRIEGHYVSIQKTSCIACNGKGIDSACCCKKCSGGTFTIEQREFKIKIPAAINNADILRLEGLGEFGPDGNGDLFICIRIKPHDKFDRIGNDLLTKLKVPLVRAIGGGPMELKDILGNSLSIHIDRGCQYGDVVTVPGKGIAGGSLLIRLEVVIPKLTEEKAKSVIKTMLEEGEPSGIPANGS